MPLLPGGASMAAMSVDQIGLIVAIVFILAGVVAGLYTRTGSGIETHPWGRHRSVMAPDAAEHDEVSGKDEREHADVTRGTR